MRKLRLRETLERSTDPQAAHRQQEFERTSVCSIWTPNHYPWAGFSVPTFPLGAGLRVWEVLARIENGREYGWAWGCPGLMKSRTKGGGEGRLLCWETGAGTAQAKTWELRSFSSGGWVIAKGNREEECREWLCYLQPGSKIELAVFCSLWTNLGL